VGRSGIWHNNKGVENLGGAVCVLRKGAEREEQSAQRLEFTTHSALLYALCNFIRLKKGEYAEFY
jgi:hypothetical protein